METLRVDFNRSRNGLLISSLSRASGPVELGDLVQVFQPGEDDMTATARVVSVGDGGLVELLVAAEQVEAVTSGFMSQLLSWHVKTSSALAQPSANYYPVNPQKQSWKTRTPVTA